MGRRACPRPGLPAALRMGSRMGSGPVPVVGLPQFWGRASTSCRRGPSRCPYRARPSCVPGHGPPASAGSSRGGGGRAVRQQVTGRHTDTQTLPHGSPSAGALGPGPAVLPHAGLLTSGAAWKAGAPGRQVLWAGQEAPACWRQARRPGEGCEGVWMLLLPTWRECSAGARRAPGPGRRQDGPVLAAGRDRVRDLAQSSCPIGACRPTE